MKAKTSPTWAMAEFVADLSYEQIPIPLVEHIKLCLLDTIGCGLFGSTLPWVEKVALFAEEMHGRPEATVWGRPSQIPAANAALVNGTAVHSFEIDDLHKTSILHPGAVTVTAALAMAERLKICNGRELITALVVGYETGIRIGRSVGTSHLRKGFHPTGTHGTFAAGAAAGRLLALDAASMVHVLGIAGTQAAGLMAAQYGAMVKRFHAGRAAQSGVYAALLAKHGFTGITDILEAEYGGYATVMGTDSDLSTITDGLGSNYASAQVGFKAYSAGGSTHTAHEAVKSIMIENQITPTDIENILIRATTATVHHTSWKYIPEGATSAQMNMQYVVAVTVFDGQLFIDQFTEKKINDPRILAFTRKICVQADPELDGLGPDFRHAIIAQVKTRQGQTYTRRVDTAKGSTANPMAKAELIEKFTILAGKVLNIPSINRLQHIVLHLEEFNDIEELTVLLGGITQ